MTPVSTESYYELLKNKRITKCVFDLFFSDLKDLGDLSKSPQIIR